MSAKYDILRKLEGGDLRSIGRVDEVIADVLEDQSLFGVLFDGMLRDDPLIRMRSADAVEKISEGHPEFLQPYKSQLITQVARSQQQEVRWHVAQMLPRLTLSSGERKVAVDILMEYMDDKSRIVKTFSMQALADLAGDDPDLRSQVTALLEWAAIDGSPAMKSRARKLLKSMGSPLPTC